MPRPFSHKFALSWLFGAFLGTAESQSGESFGLVADAGSTGTRMYLFHIAAGGEAAEITDLGKGPALSSFQAKPDDAVKAVGPQLDKAKDFIPEAMRASVPVSVFATAGMRLVPKAAQDAIYGALRRRLLHSASVPFAFDAATFQARTISGREEGIFALVAANYLAKHLAVSLRASTGSLMGVLDLGGSSTQVAAPPSLGIGEHLAPKLGVENTFVRSFLNLGMERMRHRTFASFVEEADADARAQRTVSNPCAFAGQSEASEAWQGVGVAAACEAKIQAVLQEERAACLATAAEPEVECLSSDPVPLPQGPAGTAKFYLISGYMYVTDFAAWLLRQTGKKPEAQLARPTIAEMREAAAVVCDQAWSEVESLSSDPARKHKFTPPHKVPHRCFELNYIVALLSTGYGFKEDERVFNIVNDIDGGEIEWTLGAFLYGLAPTTERSEL